MRPFLLVTKKAASAAFLVFVVGKCYICSSLYYESKI